MSETLEPLHHRGAEGAEGPQREVTEKVIGAAIEVHRVLGPGLLESVYQEALEAELAFQGIEFSKQRSVPLVYKGRQLGAGLRLDLVVQNAVIVEVKAVQQLDPVHEAQLLTYLRLTGLQVGLLLNFHAVALRRGIKRIVNSPRPSASSAPLR